MALTENQLQAKDYLQTVYDMNEMIKQYQEEVAELREMSRTIPSINYSDERVQTSGKKDAHFVRAVSKIVDKEKEIEDEICRMLDTKFRIRNEIHQLKNTTEILVLKYRYTMFMTWEQISEKMGYSLIQVQRIHAKALTSFYNKHTNILKKVG